MIPMKGQEARQFKGLGVLVVFRQGFFNQGFSFIQTVLDDSQEGEIAKVSGFVWMLITHSFQFNGKTLQILSGCVVAFTQNPLEPSLPMGPFFRQNPIQHFGGFNVQAARVEGLCVAQPRCGIWAKRCP